LVTFFLFNMLMGDPAMRFAGRHATKQQVESIRAELGLDRSLPQQYLFYVHQIVTFDYGRSWATKQKVSTMIEEGIGPSLSVTVPPFIMSIFFCIGLALLTAYFRGTVLDKTVVVVCLALLSVSSLVYIVLLQYFLAYYLGLFPISGWDTSWTGRWEYVELPWIILFVLTLGSNILVYRSVVLDEVFQDYVRTARAKGLSSPKVFAKHVLKNAMIPIITIIVIDMPFLITGTVLIEAFFSIPGIGGLIVKALNESDFPVVKAMTVVTSIAYMFFNLVADVLYTMVDPRVKMS
jgi:peptide/nickel transport system permease protein